MRTAVQTARKVHTTHRDAREKLPIVQRTYGLDFLGGGCYGRAYRMANGRVLKIGLSVRDGSMGFIAHVAAYCAKHGKPPAYCPYVYEFKREADYWWAVMEYCEPVQAAALRKEGLAANDPKYIFSSFMPTYTPEDQRRMHSALWEQFGPLMWDAYGKVMDEDDVGWDTHAGNVGITTDGRLVCYDPLGSCTKLATVPRRIQPKAQHGPRRGRWAH